LKRLEKEKRAGRDCAGALVLQIMTGQIAEFCHPDG